MLLFLLLLDADDHDKFVRLYSAYRFPLEHYALSLLHNKLLAEEATQETFIRILKNLNKVAENESGRTWHYMITIIKNISFTMLKKEKSAIKRLRSILKISNRLKNRHGARFMPKNWHKKSENILRKI